MSSLERTVQHIHRVAGPTPANDRQLLAAFAATRDEAAFAELVRRHGRLVRGVCRRILGADAAADDTFQAAFLLLARKAGASGWGESVAGWLHATAWHVAHKAHRAALRRRRHEAHAPPRPSPADPAASVAWRELCGIFDEELARLPERLRSPLALCYLEGHTRDEAAAQLGCSLDQVKRRLARGRAILRMRLTRRGVSLAVAGLPAAVAQAPVPAALVTMTVEAARTFVAGGAIAVAVGELVQPSLAWLTLTKLGLAGVLLVAGGVSLGMMTSGQPEAAPQVAVAPPQAPAAPQPGRDQFGDPLPEGAIARLGTLRLSHGDGLQDLALSADGKRVLSMGRSDLRLWDTATGQEMMPPLVVQSDLVTARYNTPERHLLRGTLTADGKQVIALTTDAGILTATWYDDSGAQRRRLSFEGQLAVPGVTRIAFSPDRRMLATAHHREARLWDLETGKSLYRLPAPVDKFAFAADGRTLATSDGDFGLHVWELATGTARHHFRGDSKTFEHIALAPDGRWLATVDFTVTPMPARDGKAALASAGGGIKVRIWDTAKGEQTATLDARGQLQQLIAMPDGRSLLAAHLGFTPGVRQWDVTTGQPGRDWPAGLGALQTITGSADGSTYATASSSGVIRTWDSATLQERFRPDVPRGSVYEGAFAPDGRTILIRDSWSSVSEWQVATGRLVRHIDLAAPPGGRITWLARSRDGRLLAVSVKEPGAPSNGPSAIHVLESGSGRLAHRLVGHRDTIVALAFSPDGRLLAVADYAGVLRLWDTTTGKEERVIPTKAGWSARVLAFTADGSRLIGLGSHQPAYVWETSTGREVATWQLPDVGVSPDVPGRYLVMGQTISPDGRYAASSLHQRDQLPQPGEIVVSDTLTGKEVQRIAGLSGPQYHLVFSRDGRMLAYAMPFTILSHDATVRLLDVATGRELKSFPGHRAQVTGLTFSPDDKRLISGSADGTALVWDISGVR